VKRVWQLVWISTHCYSQRPHYPWDVCLELLSQPKRGLPYHDQFSEGRRTEWQEFGGTWSIAETAYEMTLTNGRKTDYGSSFWTNYKAEADLQLLGRGMQEYHTRKRRRRWC